MLGIFRRLWTRLVFGRWPYAGGRTESMGETRYLRSVVYEVPSAYPPVASFVTSRRRRRLRDGR